MEGVHGTDKASKLESEDVISSMPDNVITDILNRLPTRDAVRTGILARNWRLKWTLLTQLVFDVLTSQYLLTTGPKGKKYYDSSIICRLLLHIKGPVTKFYLGLLDYRLLHAEDFNHWVLFLSTRGLKEFTIYNHSRTPLKLHTHLFSCLELKHLKLSTFNLRLPPTFHGFPNLLSLDLQWVGFEGGGCEFISRCPLLEILKIGFHGPVWKLNPSTIENLGNLKILHLPSCKLGNMVMTTSSIFQLLGFFPKLEELHLDLRMCKFVAEAVSRKRDPTMFSCLKTLQLSSLLFGDGLMLSFAVELILGSPNLQTLYIPAGFMDDVPPAAAGFLKLDCSTRSPLQLRHVEFGFKGSKNAVCLIRHILAHSPFLEKIIIDFASSMMSEQRSMFVTELLKLHRASPKAQIEISVR